MDSPVDIPRDIPGGQKGKILPILVSRTVVFLFIMCLLTMLLYFAGTIQGFVDSTQLFLLRLYAVLGIFLLIAAIFGMVLNMRRFFQRKKARYLLRAAGYILLVVFCAVTVLTAMFIIIVSEGNVVSWAGII